ncbi:MAG: glycosyltransferase, partial [Rhodocyclaceae bacterium]
MSADLAIFAATSGHSGVDRVLRNLVPAIARLGVTVDVLGIEGHGPHFDQLPEGARHLPLGA